MANSKGAQPMASRVVSVQVPLRTRWSFSCSRTARRLLVDDLLRLAVDLLAFLLRVVARLFLLSSSGLGVPRVRLVGHRIVARLLLRGLRPRLLRQSRLLGGELLALLRG